jgi:hypothetical protein
MGGGRKKEMMTKQGLEQPRCPTQDEMKLCEEKMKVESR